MLYPLSLMDEIEVTARYEEGGKPFPTIFRWKDQPYLVDSVGRRWEDEAGEHLLVLVPGGRVYELLLSCTDHRWYLNPVGPEPGKV